MRTQKDHDAILEAIRNFKPSPEYWEKVRADAIAFEEYMENLITMVTVIVTGV